METFYKMWKSKHIICDEITAVREFGLPLNSFENLHKDIIS